jgi:hypothetical protein
VFHHENGRFIDRTNEAGLGGTNGWWNTVATADLRGTGRTDLVLGNLGLNSYIKASRKEPARLYVADFAQNGSLQQILTFYKHGVSYPIAGRDELVRLIPSLRSRYPSYKSFGASTIDEILPAAALQAAQRREAYDFASAVALNNGNCTLRLEHLPVEAQFAPVYAALADDFDGDGKADLVLGGNFYGVTPVRGRYDASYGLLLHGLGNGRFQSVDMEANGLAIEGQVRHMKLLRHANGDRLIVVARNDNTLQIIRTPRSGTSRSMASAH